VTRSANNPPAPLWGEGVLDLACRRLKKPRGSVLTGVRVTRRGNLLRPLFFACFFDSILSPQNPSRSLPKGLPTDPKIEPKPVWEQKHSSRDPLPGRFLPSTMLCSFWVSILVQILSKNHCFYASILQISSTFFEPGDPHDNMQKLM